MWLMGIEGMEETEAINDRKEGAWLHIYGAIRLRSLMVGLNLTALLTH